MKKKKSILKDKEYLFFKIYSFFLFNVILMLENIGENI